MTRSLAAMCLMACAAHANATVWLCSADTSERVVVSRAPDATQASAAEGRALPRDWRVSNYDIRQAFLGYPVLIGRSWLLAVMLPPDDPLTRIAFVELGISAEAAAALARSSGLVDRGIRIAPNAAAAVAKVARNAPAVTYDGIYYGQEGVRTCN